MTYVELLAPARTAHIARQAIIHGADAVYIGPPSHGARAEAANSVADIQALCDFAHPYGAKVYVTLNTLIYPHELTHVEKLIHLLYHAGVDALIVQDMAVLEMDLPPIALHASTQCDIRTPQKAQFLAAAGFSQLVLPRELTLDETAAMHRAVPNTPLEAFVHGALCVSYSGDCRAGQLLMGRSANRGQCPQICRLPYTLTDGHGNIITHDSHLLSLADINRLDIIEPMLEAGITSFKIEGRLKDENYVKNVTAAYRRAIDQVIERHPTRYTRSSFGASHIPFTPNLGKSFNRGFTHYFSTSPKPTSQMATIRSPKWIGTPVGKVISVNGTAIKARLSESVNNGDGLGYFNTEGQFTGFRANSVQGSTIRTLTPVAIAPGTPIYRNADRLFTDQLNTPGATRTIALQLKLAPTPWGIALSGVDERGVRATVTLAGTFQQARTPQTSRRSDTLTKTGDTIYRVDTLTDTLGELFIPASQLTTLRRQLINALNSTWKATRPIDKRHPEIPHAQLPLTTLTYRHNVANPLAEQFYRRHGAEIIEKAIEVEPQPDRPLLAMQTRYCLRRELGACLRQKGARHLTPPLTLTHGSFTLNLEFDCRNCQMNVYVP